MTPEQMQTIPNIEQLAAGLNDARSDLPIDEKPPPSSNFDEGGKRMAQADVLIKAALESGAELFHTPTDDLYISFDVDDRRQTWPIRSKPARQWLIRGFYRLTKKAPNPNAVQTALNLLEAKARFDGDKHEVHLRTAWHGGSLYYDLCDDRWRAVQVSKVGWRIVDKAPVKFIRYRHMAAQVDPAHGGNLDDLFDFVNVKSETDRRLLRAWNVAGLIPDIPRPAQVLYGDQGSGKSTTAKRQRELSDPSNMPLLKAKDEQEVVQGLAHHYCAIFDNITNVNDWLSDLLCRAVTGEGFTKRQLYTDSEDIMFAYKRLLILTGIGLAVTKPDLLDRSLIIGVDRIPESHRQRERELDAEFGNAKPKLFGALLDALVGAIKEHDKIKFERLPRMADFAAWGMAFEVGAGRDPEHFRQAYDVNIGRQNEEAIAASTMATVLIPFLDDLEQWTGTAQELYAGLKAKADDMKIPAKAFAGSAAAMSKKLREVRPNLAALGWHIEFGKAGGARSVTITRIGGETAVHADPTVQPGTTNTDGKGSMDGKNPTYSPLAPGISYQSQNENVTDQKIDVSSEANSGVTGITDGDHDGGWEDL